MDKYQLKPFLDAIDNSSPTPGGGAVAAYVGALGIALARMSGHVSFKKKSFLSLTKEQQEHLLNQFNYLKKILQEVITFVDKDEDAFLDYMKEFRLAKDMGLKESPGLTKATQHIFFVPEQLIKSLNECFDPILDMLPYISPSIIGDVLIGMLLLQTAAESSLITMFFNLNNQSSNELKMRYNSAYEQINLNKQRVNQLLRQYQILEE